MIPMTGSISSPRTFLIRATSITRSAIGGSFVLLGVNSQFRRQSESALRALRVEIDANRLAADLMTQAWAAGGPKEWFEAGKADPSWLRRSIWDSQLPFFVQLVDQETLARLSEAYSTLEAVPGMLANNPNAAHRQYIRGGWIDAHIVKIGGAFLTAQQHLDRVQTRRNSERWFVRLREHLPSWLCRTGLSGR